MNNEELHLLMDVQALINNMFYGTDHYAAVNEQLNRLDVLVRKYRGDNPPFCYGLDDCSSHAMSMCFWVNDCGSEESIAWHEKNHPKGY